MRYIMKKTINYWNDLLYCIRYHNPYDLRCYWGNDEVKDFYELYEILKSTDPDFKNIKTTKLKKFFLLFHKSVEKLDKKYEKELEKEKKAKLEFEAALSKLTPEEIALFNIKKDKFNVED